MYDYVEKHRCINTRDVYKIDFSSHSRGMLLLLLLHTRDGNQAIGRKEAWALPYRFI